MGLLEDILNTIQTSGAPGDPRAKGTPVPAPAPTASGGQGMSPIAKVLLALLAVYAAKNLRRAPSPSTQPTGSRGGTTTADEGTGGSALDDLLKGPLGGLLRGGTPGSAGAGGGLGDLLKGPLGGILGGAAAGTVLNGGLNDLLKQLQQSGQSDAVDSWVGRGPNKGIDQTDIADALGSDTLDQLTSYTGMQRGDMLSGLSQELPRFVDALTPAGRVLTDEEARRML